MLTKDWLFYISFVNDLTSWCFAPVATQRVSLTLKSLILSPLLLGCCHSSSMLSFPLRCFHFSYYVAALSPMLLLLRQYCCSSFNIAAPPSMLPLHLDVASPPSILTLQRVLEMRMVICRKEQSSWWPPPLMLPLFLWWIDVSANSQYYCSSVVVAAFP